MSEAGAEELSRLLSARGDALSAEDALEALRNPHLTADAVRGIAARRALVSVYEVRKALAVCAHTPEAIAIDLVSGLYWTDLVAIGSEVRIRPAVRRAADLALVIRLPRLAVGEKISIARRCDVAVIAHLRNDPTPRVISALLENPRLTEGLLAPLIASEMALPEILKLVAANPRWGVRHGIRLAICRNPRSPLAVVLPLLPGLRKDELRALGADPRLAQPLRHRAQLLSGRLG
ncbi:MAG TPA: hypothetical protein VN783_09580 [Thermoanaerobaculia bacterium]|nr:hypothetical protein [Thermoanaerobaculia bacterium]